MSDVKAPASLVEQFFFVKIKNSWQFFKAESFAFKCICLYLFVEYFRPQAIFPFIDFMPWAQVFLTGAFLAAFSDPKAQFRMDPMHIYVLLFSFAIHASFLVAYSIEWSQRYYIFFIQWIVIYFLICWIVTTRERFFIFFLILFFCALKIAAGTARIWVMRGFSFTKWGLMGPQGYFQNSGELAVLMVVLFPLAVYLYINHKDSCKNWEKWILIAGFVCPILTILGSSSRGSQVALALQLLFLFWRKIFTFKALVTIIILTYGVATVLPNEQKERFTSIGEDKSSLQRTLYWKNGWEMMKEHPFLGVGFYNFIPYYDTHYPNDRLYGKAQLPHNIFVQVGTDAGFTGLLFYMAIITLALTRRLKVKLDETKPDELLLFSIWKGLRLGIFGFAIAGQFVTIGYYPFLWISIAFQTSLFLIINNRIADKGKRNAVRR